MSLHAALLDCLVFECDFPGILFSQTFWMTILLSFWEPCSYIQLSSRALSLRAALQPFLSAHFHSRRLCFHWMIPLVVSCQQCRLLLLGSCVSFLLSFCGTVADLLFPLWFPAASVSGLQFWTLLLRCQPCALLVRPFCFFREPVITCCSPYFFSPFGFVRCRFGASSDFV